MSTDWNQVRAEFPALQNRVFLDAACVSIMPARADEAVRHFSRELATPSLLNSTDHHIWMDAQRETAPPQVAKLLDVDQRHIALVESTTHGLNIAAQSIPWRCASPSATPRTAT